MGKPVLAAAPGGDNGFPGQSFSLFPLLLLLKALITILPLPLFVLTPPRPAALLMVRQASTLAGRPNRRQLETDKQEVKIRPETMQTWIATCSSHCGTLTRRGGGSREGERGFTLKPSNDTFYLTTSNGNKYFTNHVLQPCRSFPKSL